MIYSKKRELVLDYVRTSCTHPTAEEVYSGLRALDADISLATVYRNLNQLAESGLLQRIATPSGADRFDGNITQHLHAICTRCGRVEDIPRNALPDLCKIASNYTDMKLSDVTLVFHGVCSVCRNHTKN